MAAPAGWICTGPAGRGAPGGVRWALGGGTVRARIQHALGGHRDASVRVYGYWAGLIVTARAPRTGRPGRIR